EALALLGIGALVDQGQNLAVALMHGAGPGGERHGLQAIELDAAEMALVDLERDGGAAISARRQRAELAGAAPIVVAGAEVEAGETPIGLGHAPISFGRDDRPPGPDIPRRRAETQDTTWLRRLTAARTAPRSRPAASARRRRCAAWRRRRAARDRRRPAAPAHIRRPCAPQRRPRRASAPRRRVPAPETRAARRASRHRSPPASRGSRPRWPRSRREQRRCCG